MLGCCSESEGEWRELEGKRKFRKIKYRVVNDGELYAFILKEGNAPKTVPSVWETHLPIYLFPDLWYRLCTL